MQTPTDTQSDFSPAQAYSALGVAPSPGAVLHSFAPEGDAARRIIPEKARPTAKTVYGLSLVHGDDAYRRMSFWRACRVADLWRHAERGDGPPDISFAGARHLGYTLLSNISVYIDGIWRPKERDRLAPANDGRGEQAPEANRTALEALSKVFDMVKVKGEPIFFELRAENDAEIGFDCVVVPLALSEDGRRQYCCCLSPV